MLNLFISSNRLFLTSLGFLYTRSCHLWIKRVHFFSNLVPFISFSCLTVQARAFNIMMNRSGESRHPCLVPDLGGKAFSLAPLTMRLAVAFSQMPLSGWRSYFLVLVCLSVLFNQERVLSFVKCFFFIIFHFYLAFTLLVNPCLQTENTYKAALG